MYLDLDGYAHEFLIFILTIKLGGTEENLNNLIKRQKPSVVANCSNAIG